MALNAKTEQEQAFQSQIMEQVSLYTQNFVESFKMVEDYFKETAALKEDMKAKVSHFCTVAGKLGGLRKSFPG